MNDVLNQLKNYVEVMHVASADTEAYAIAVQGIEELRALWIHCNHPSADFDEAVELYSDEHGCFFVDNVA